jgi:hypothetical protein
VPGIHRATHKNIIKCQKRREKFEQQSDSEHLAQNLAWCLGGFIFLTTKTPRHHSVTRRICSFHLQGFAAF